jgi:hypothetical protein
VAKDLTQLSSQGVSIALPNQIDTGCADVYPRWTVTQNWIAQTSTSTSSVTPIGDVEVPTTTQLSTTAFKESANVLVVETAVGLDRPLSHAYPVDTPTQLLNKPYQIAQFSWTNVWAGDQIVLPDALINIPTIQNVLKRFRYYRANIKLEFKLTTTQFHQGSIIIGWLPCWDSTAPAPTLPQLSGMNASVLSASTQDSLSIEIPYLSPNAWMDVQAGVIALDDRHSTVFIKPLNALIATAVNMPNAVTITVFASFTDIQVSGFRSHMSSKRPNREAHQKQEKGIDEVRAIHKVSKLIREAPVSTALGMLAGLIDTYMGDLSKPNSQVAPQHLLASYGNSASLCRGLYHADQLSQYPNAELSQARVMGGMETSHMSINELARRPILYYSFAMTTLFSEFNFKVSPRWLASNWNDWLSHTAYAFRYWRGSIKWSIHFCVPAFYSFRVRVTATVQTSTIDNYGDLASAIIDVKGETWFDFVVPFERAYDWASVTDEVPADVPEVTITRITDIQGSSAPSSPIVYVNIFRAGGEDISFAGLRGARDFVPPEKNRVKELVVDAHVSLDDKFKRPFEGVIKGVNLSVEQGWVMPEMALSVSDCCKRASDHLTGGSILGGTASTYPCVFPEGGASLNYATIGREPLHYFGSVFWFWRGGRILTKYQSNAKIYLAQKVTTNPSWGDGAAHWYPNPNDASLKFAESVQIPYYFERPWHPIVAPGHRFTENYDVTAGPLDLTGAGDGVPVTLSGADDFVLLHPVPFFPLDTYPAAQAEGKKNFQSTTGNSRATKNKST